jgi:predicted TIM-barrel fold metal-dependent hydrolase
MSNHLAPSRRQFLRAAASAAALCAAAPALGKDSDPIPIIDTHQHLWDLKQFRLPWLDNAGPVLNRNYVTADYLKAAEGLNLERAVYMEVDVAPEQRRAEAEWVVGLCKRGDTPTVAAVIGGSPASEKFPAYITRFKNSPFVKGIRESLRRGSSTDEKFLRGLRLLGELGMSFDLLHGPDLLAEAAAVAKGCPDTRFVLDHCGNADCRDFRPTAGADARRRRKQWEDGVSSLAEHTNVICKISGVMEAAAPDQFTADDVAPVVDYCLDRFGLNRVIFASNWPVVNRGGSFAEWVRILWTVVDPREKSEGRKLFRDNAVRFYGLR